LMEIGLKLAVARSGRPLTPKLTVPINPVPGVTAAVECLRAPERPWRWTERRPRGSWRSPRGWHSRYGQSAAPCTDRQRI